MSWWKAEILLMGALPWVFYPFVKPGCAVFRQCINLTLRGFLEVDGEEEARRWREALERAMLRDAAQRIMLYLKSSVTVGMIKSLDTPARGGDSAVDTTTPALP